MCFVACWTSFDAHFVLVSCAFKSTMGKANSCVASNAFSMVPCSWRHGYREYRDLKMMPTISVAYLGEVIIVFPQEGTHYSVQDDEEHHGGNHWPCNKIMEQSEIKNTRHHDQDRLQWSLLITCANTHKIERSQVWIITSSAKEHRYAADVQQSGVLASCKEEPGR